SPIQLNYKANVFQSTGEEWKNVRLKLSTANPSLGGVKPELYSWYLDFYQPLAKALQGRVAGVQVQRSLSVADKKKQAEVIEEIPQQAVNISDFTETIQTSLNTEFDISLPYTVLSASKPTL